MQTCSYLANAGSYSGGCALAGRVTCAFVSTPATAILDRRNTTGRRMFVPSERCVHHRPESRERQVVSEVVQLPLLPRRHHASVLTAQTRVEVPLWRGHTAAARRLMIHHDVIAPASDSRESLARIQMTVTTRGSAYP